MQMRSVVNVRMAAEAGFFLRFFTARINPCPDTRRWCGGFRCDPREGAGRPHFLESMKNEDLVNEFVVDDGGGQRAFGFFLGCVFGAHDAPLANHVAVLLSGNFLWHFENHLDQGVHG